MWIDVATREMTDDIDYSELEKLFSAETQEAKKPNPRMLHVCVYFCAW